MNKYFQELKNRWQLLAPKDQLYLVVLGICLLVYLCYKGVLMPLQDMKDNEWKRAQATAASLSNVRTLAATLVSSRENSQGGGRKGSLVEVVDRSLRENSLRMAGLQPSGSDGARLRLEEANFDNLLAWLHEMEVKNGLQIRDISVAQGSQVGAVAVNLRLQQP